MITLLSQLQVGGQQAGWRGKNSFVGRERKLVSRRPRQSLLVCAWRKGRLGVSLEGFSLGPLGPRAGGIYWCKWISLMMVLVNCNVGDVLSSGPTPDERYLPPDTDFRFHSIRQSILFNM